MVTLIERQLELEEKLRELATAGPQPGTWALRSEVAELQAAPGAAIRLLLSSKGNLRDERVFACSKQSVVRIARAITEHLTGYAA